MGWKNVKEHYGIKHIVHVSDGVIWVGSGYLPEIMGISMEGALAKKYSDTCWEGNVDFLRYEKEMLADPEKLRELVISPDTFERSLPTYTFQGGQVVKKFCEKYGWPNVTHEGETMYDNTFFVTEREAAEYGKNDTSIRIDWLKRDIVRDDALLQQLRRALADEEKALAALEEKYPG